MSTKTAMTFFVARQVSADPAALTQARRRRKKRVLAASLAEAVLTAEAARRESERSSGGRVPHPRTAPLATERIAQLVAERSAARAGGMAAHLLHG